MPTWREIEEQYRAGMLSEARGFDWFAGDPKAAGAGQTGRTVTTGRWRAPRIGNRGLNRLETAEQLMKRLIWEGGGFVKARPKRGTHGNRRRRH